MKKIPTTSRDGTTLNLVQWSPDGAPRADILLVHGLAEHMGRYAHVAEALTTAGYQVTGVELRGHGESEGRRGHVDEWRQYVDDFRAASYKIGRSHYVIAHSMGSLVTLDALRTPIGPDILGVCLSNPLVGISVKAPAIKVMAAGLLSKILPTISLSNELDTNHLSRDVEVIRKYEQDEMVYSTITPRWYTEMVAAIERVFIESPKGSIPLLMLVGDGDRITSVEASRKFFERYGASDKDLINYPGLYHELFNEPEKDQVLSDVVDWLKREASFTPLV
jgi:alpha-beta hydrolase superfamily lysophospholipase